MYKKILLFVISFSLGFAVQAQWKALGSLGFSSGPTGEQSLAFHPSSDEPYVAFKDGDMAGKASVMKYDGSTWSLVGPAGFSLGTADFIDLAFNPATEEPYIVFTDGAYGDKTTVMKYDGSVWDTVGITAFSMGPGFYHSLAFNPMSAEPVVAFQDMGTGGKGVLMEFDGMTWGMVGGVPFSPAAAFNMSLIFDPTTGDPLIGFEDDAFSGKTTVVTFDSGMSAWGSIGPPGFSTGIAVGQSIAIDAMDDIYIAYIDLAESSKVTVMKLDPMSFTWIPVGSPGFTPSSASFLSFAFMPGTTTPFVAFTDSASSDFASVMSFDGSSWSMVGMSGFTPDVSSFTDLAFHPATGDPYVAFADASVMGASSVMWFDPAILPVELSSFTAKWKNRFVQLNWETASESNNDFFIVERSFDARNFQEIASVSGKYNSQVTQTYQHLDRLAKTQAQDLEKIYYRLKQVDLDGSFSYSEIIAVDNRTLQVSVSPNPTKGQLQLSFDKSRNTEIRIFDRLGKLVFQEKSSGKYLDLDLTGFSAGVYWLVVEHEGAVLSQERIVLLE